MANQTTTRTKKVGPLPILGGLFGQESHYETRITDGRRTVTGPGVPRRRPSATRRANGKGADRGGVSLASAGSGGDRDRLRSVPARRIGRFLDPQ